jgi:hypothetical protein
MTASSPIRVSILFQMNAKPRQKQMKNARDRKAAALYEAQRLARVGCWRWGVQTERGDLVAGALLNLRLGFESSGGQLL